MLESLQFLTWLFFQFLLGAAALIVALSLGLQTARWNWPAWLRILTAIGVLVAYAVWQLWDSDDDWIYRLAALIGAPATYRFARGFSETFLPSFLAAFNAAKNKKG